MGKFDGYLICSDLDGTFRNKSDIMPNYNAVKYFTDNGGRFTFATGRTISHLAKLDYNSLMNAPACICNGGGIYDYEKRELLYEGRVDFTVGEFVEVVRSYSGIKPDIIVYNSCFEDEYRFRELENVMQDKSLKAIKLICVFQSPEDADKFKVYARSQDLFKNCYIGKSWSVGVEFNSVNSTKGNAISFIKNYLGNIHTAIGIGDYENDIPLLTNADLGVAVGDALDCVKEVADLIVKPHTQSSVEDLIKYLDSVLKADKEQ